MTDVEVKVAARLAVRTTRTPSYEILFIPILAADTKQAEKIGWLVEKAQAVGDLVPITEWANTEFRPAITAGGWNLVAPHSSAPAVHAQALRIVGEP